MLEQYFMHVASSNMLTLCSALMVCLFLFNLFGIIGELIGSKRIRQVDFRSPIVSIGIFGTFLGILAGLYGFDSTNITESVPFLLEGLKFAFATSVFGMLLSVILSITHKLFGAADQENEILKSIDHKMGALTNSMKSLAETIESPQELIQQFTELKGFLKAQLEQINTSLEKALEQLGAGATKEVINALETVIVEFNQNLQEQFGENFKELNDACKKLLEWQNRYRDHIDGAEKHLTVIRQSLDISASSATQLVKSNKGIQETCRDVAQLIKTYDVQIQNLEIHLSNCKKLGDDAKQFLTTTQQALAQSQTNIVTFSDTIENSVSKQSQALTQLVEDIDKQVPQALGELEDVLTKITNQFARDYKSLFEFVTSKG